MAGYANRVVRIGFPDLTEDTPGTQECFITIRNPRTVSPDELTTRDVPTDPTGRPLDMELAQLRSYETIARLIVAWRMYDATDFALNEDGEPLDQRPLPLPATPELVAKLPVDAIRALNEEITAALSPK